MPDQLLELPKVPDGLEPPLHSFLQAVKNRLDAAGGNLSATQLRPTVQDLIDKLVIDAWPPLAGKLPSLKVAGGVVSHSLSGTAPDTVEVSFTPRVVIAFAEARTTGAASWGFRAGDEERCIYSAHEDVANTYEDRNVAGRMQTGTGEHVEFTLTFRRNAFIVTWSKNGSPTGASRLMWVALA